MLILSARYDCSYKVWGSCYTQKIFTGLYEPKIYSQPVWACAGTLPSKLALGYTLGRSSVLVWACKYLGFVRAQNFLSGPYETGKLKFMVKLATSRGWNFCTSKHWKNWSKISVLIRVRRSDPVLPSWLYCAWNAELVRPHEFLFLCTIWLIQFDDAWWNL